MTPSACRGGIALPSEPIHSVAVETSAWRRRVAFCLTGVLAVAAVITLGYWGMRGLGAADTEALESPLMMSVARELVSGPGVLYGPFGRDNPLVLIHAPLYYRLAALAAWPMYRAGITPIAAARIAGRSISVLGLLAALAAAYRLARLGGGSRLAGGWAVLLIAAAPMLEGQPFTVRPDMLGIALQSAGLLLVLPALTGEQGTGRRIIGGYAAFGLAICVKQHLVAEAAVCTGLLVANRRRRGSAVPLATIGRGLAAAGMIVSAIYGAEWIITDSHLWDAAFVAAGEVSRLYPGGRDHASLILYGFVGRSSGFLILMPLIGLTIVGYSGGSFRRILIIAGIGLLGVSIVNLALTAYYRHDLEIAGFLVVISLSAPIFLACAISGRSILLGDRIDGILWICLAAEFALTLFLAYLSSGSWLNYGIQGTVLLAVLAARAGARVLEAAPAPRHLGPLALGALTILLASYASVSDAELRLGMDQAAVDQIFEHLKLPRSAVFFTDRPGRNRLAGRLGLVYDHWLYRVFESARLADPRSGWMPAVLARGDVRAIVTTSDRPELEGTGIPLRHLGFRPDVNVGPYYVWVR
jgi:hypothetical protein